MCTGVLVSSLRTTLEGLKVWKEIWNESMEQCKNTIFPTFGKKSIQGTWHEPAAQNDPKLKLPNRVLGGFD